MDDAWRDPDGTAEILKQVPPIFDHLGGLERARAEPVVRELLGDPGFRARIATLVYAAAQDSARAGLTAAAVFEALAAVLDAGLDAGLKPGGAAGPGGGSDLNRPGAVNAPDKGPIDELLQMIAEEEFAKNGEAASGRAPGLSTSRNWQPRKDKADPDLSWIPSLALDWPDDHPADGPFTEEAVRTAEVRTEPDGKALEDLLEDLLEDGITETGRHAPGCGPE